MNGDGHVGVALAAYSPIGFVTAASGAPALSLLGAGLAVAIAPLPDVDTALPLLHHRGYSHTAWFGLLVAVPCAALGASVGATVGATPPVTAAAFCAVVGATTVCSHLAADALTPAGIRPFAPFGRRWTLGLVRASNRLANVLLLWLGVSVLGWALLMAIRLR